MSKHTSTPWEVLKINRQYFIAAKPYEGHPYYNRTATVEVLSDEDYPTREADVRFIVEACNAYDDLVAKVSALEADVERLKQALEDYGDHSEKCKRKAADCFCGFDAVRGKV
jgi:hypothetical protein